jgi:hypothetical protein
MINGYAMHTGIQLTGNSQLRETILYKQHRVILFAVMLHTEINSHIATVMHGILMSILLIAITVLETSRNLILFSVWIQQDLWVNTLKNLKILLERL